MFDFSFQRNKIDISFFFFFWKIIIIYEDVSRIWWRVASRHVECPLWAVNTLSARTSLDTLDWTRSLLHQTAGPISHLNSILFFPYFFLKKNNLIFQKDDQCYIKPKHRIHLLKSSNFQLETFLFSKLKKKIEIENQDGR